MLSKWVHFSLWFHNKSFNALMQRTKLYLMCPLFFLETYKTGIPLPWKQWADGSAHAARVSLCCALACKRSIIYQLNYSKKKMKYFFLLMLIFLSFLQNNKISSITDQTFCKGNSSYYIRPNMDQVRLDGNPIKLWEYPNSFICLHSLPVGWYNWNDPRKLYIGVKKSIGQGSEVG